MIDPEYKEAIRRWVSDPEKYKMNCLEIVQTLLAEISRLRETLSIYKQNRKNILDENQKLKQKLTRLRVLRDQLIEGEPIHQALDEILEEDK